MNNIYYIYNLISGFGFYNFNRTRHLVSGYRVIDFSGDIPNYDKIINKYKNKIINN